MTGYKAPTKQDADLLIKLLRMDSNPQMEHAMTWLDEEFKAKTYAEFKKSSPEGTAANRNFGRIMGGFELAGALVSHGLLNENLYFDLSPIGAIWERLGPIVEGQRKEMDPQLWENAVWLAERQKKWLKTVWKPKLAWKLRK
ncbi:MAG TPA: hypothetical protein VJR06_02165 [Nitrososphaerales archaeon]|nr:hypothetical protein [Nitrososphaerales archaeon]